MGEKPGWVKGQRGSMCDSEEGRVGDYGETKARLGGMGGVRSRDEH